MGASIQALASVWPLTRFYLREEYLEYINEKNPLGTKGEMSHSFARLVEELWVNKAFSSVPPVGVLEQIRRFQDRFQGNSQHDAQEFIMFLLDGMHEDCNQGGWPAGEGGKPPPFQLLRDSFPGETDEGYGAVSWEHFKRKNNSRLVELFYGQFKNTTLCPSCKHRSVKFDAFNVLNLPLPAPEHHFLNVILLRRPAKLGSLAAFSDPITSPESRGVWNELAEATGPGCRLIESYNLVFPASLQSITTKEFLGFLSAESGVPMKRLVLHPIHRSSGFQGFLHQEEFLSLPSPSQVNLLVSEVEEPDWCAPIALSTTTTTTTTTNGTNGNNGTPSKRRLLVPLDIWIRPEKSGVDMDDLQLYVEATSPPSPEKAFTLSKPKPMLSLTLCVSPDTPLSILRLQAALTLLPMLGGIAVLRKKISELPHYKTEKSTQGEAIPGYLVLLEIAARLPLCNWEERLICGANAHWLPTMCTPSIPLKEGYFFTASSLTTAAALPPVNISHPPPVSPVSGDAVPRSEPLFYTTLGAVALRGPFFNKLLTSDSWVQRLFATPSRLKAKELDDSELELSKLFKFFLEHESLDSSNSFSCSSCEKSVSAEKRLELWDLPEFLVINLKRYSTKMLTTGGILSQKSEKKVSFPLRGLDMTPFLRDGGGGACIYDCLAVVNQIGNIKGGHYTAFINRTARMEGKVTKDGEWFKFDDSKVSKITPASVVSNDAVSKRAPHA